MIEVWDDEDETPRGPHWVKWTDGWVLIDESGKVKPFVQDGERFYWNDEDRSHDFKLSKGAYVAGSQIKPV